MLGNDRIIANPYFSLVFILQFVYVVCAYIKYSRVTFYGYTLGRFNQYEQLILAIYLNLRF